MAQAINRYKADLRELRFVLFEQFRLGELLGKPPYAAWGEDEVNLVLDEVHRFATEVTGPLNAVGDQGCVLENGQVRTPAGFKEAWTKLYESGFKSLTVDPDFGGQGAPHVVSALCTELASGSNTAFDMYPGLTIGAAELIAAFGTDEQKQTFCGAMFSGKWAGTMCLTEPHAGSDVGSAKTSAKRNEDGTYSIKGTKIFISGGDQDLTENIVHMVLARVEGARAGTKGLSLFIVPKFRVGPDGAVGERNDVTVVSIEHKMGIKGSSTAVLNFGDEDGCRGLLVGSEEHMGIRQMFQMMNFARIGVGIQGLAIASTAYLNALAYARERKQGTSIEQWKDPDAPRVPIIEHPNVRRMLLDMKARVEGIRCLIVKAAVHHDRAASLDGKDTDQIAYHMGQVELLTPLIKAYSSDQAFSICETGIQVLGGVGYTAEMPLEQYARDAKIFSIYEGTNHIQALDLVGRKLNQRGGANIQALLSDIQTFCHEHANHPVLAASVEKLAAAQAAVGQTVMQFLAWAQAGEMVRVPLNANRFLLMLAETTVGWLLLQGAVIAHEAQHALDEKDPDWMYYEGKVHAARHFSFTAVATVPGSAAIIASRNTSPLDIPEAAFGPA